jgi:4-hydroxy-3-methylbut-2-en-1-yl diphosphate synthase IspG/GcpE
VNAAAMPAAALAALLADCAGGICAESAAVGLIARHGHFLHQPALRRLIVTSASAGEPVAVIRWNAAILALDHGRLTGSPSEKAVLRIAASIADAGIAVRLGASLGSLDRRNIALVTDAITAANG